MALNFGKLISKEDNFSTDGVNVEITGVTSSQTDDLVLEGGQITSELVEMENAQAAIEQLEESADKAASDIAAVEGKSVEEVTEGQVVSVQQASDLSTDTEPSEIAAAHEEVVQSAENAMGRLMNCRFNKGSERLGSFKMMKTSTESISSTPLDSYKQSMEGILDTLKKARDRVIEWLKTLWTKVKAFLGKFIPYFKTFREKGNILKNKLKDMKRPVLKKEASDMKDHKWSERFVFVKEIGPNYSKFIIPSNAPVAMETVINLFKSGNPALAWQGKVNSIVTMGINGSTIFKKGKFVSVSNSEVERDPSELVIFGFPGYDLKVSAVLASGFHNGAYSDVEDNIKDHKKIEAGQYRFEINDKERECKMNASEIHKLALDCAESVIKAGAQTENLKKVESNMKKLMDKLDDLDLSKVGTPNQEHLENYLSITRKLASTIMGSITSTLSSPKLFLSVGYELLDEIKDGSKD